MTVKYRFRGIKQEKILARWRKIATGIWVRIVGIYRGTKIKLFF